MQFCQPFNFLFLLCRTLKNHLTRLLFGFLLEWSCVQSKSPPFVIIYVYWNYNNMLLLCIWPICQPPLRRIWEKFWKFFPPPGFVGAGRHFARRGHGFCVHLNFEHGGIVAEKQSTHCKKPAIAIQRKEKRHTPDFHSIAKTEKIKS